jgi:hypothetical protein
MRRHLARFVLLLSTIGTLAGCGQPVREDRSITFSGDGGRAAFQHGREGVFVVAGEGAAPEKIFQPGPDVIATSAPLWSPTDKRLLFTTAGRAEVPLPQTAPHEPDPAGELYVGGPTRYTCWLRLEAQGGRAADPVALFEADCDHPGYVAANLAVRWHPDGKQVLYVKQTAAGKHGIFAYHLQDRTSRQVFPHEAAAVVFDFSPDGRLLGCVLADPPAAGNPQPPTHDGIWVGRLAGTGWWHVPGSAHSVCDPHGLLGAVRAALPVWSPDSRRFAFRKQVAVPGGNSPGQALHFADVAARTVLEAAEAKAPFHDLHWHPGGTKVGAVSGEQDRHLVALRPGVKGLEPLGAAGVVSFAGWDSTGTRLAYVVSEPVGGGDWWAFLVVPDSLARQAVFVRKEGDKGPGRRLLGGMQMTFPHWSPNAARLSLWATFRPAYRSWLSLRLEFEATPDDPLSGLRLHAGDPAVLLDADGGVQWKAIDAREKTQVGHYYLLQRMYPEAWRWYEQAEKEPPAEAAPGTDAGFFRWYCLTKVGRQAHADEELRRFESRWLESFRAARKARPRPVVPQAAFGAADFEPTDDQLRRYRDLYEAEVFLSLDAAEDGEAFFRRALHGAGHDAERLGKALVLSQFLLLNHKHSEYADLAADVVLPGLLRAWKPRTAGAGPLNSSDAMLAYGDALSLVPLFCLAFLEGLPKNQVRALQSRWHKAHALADDDPKRLVIDLLLAAAYSRLGDTKAADEAGRRVVANPMKIALVGETDIAGFVQALREAPAWLEGLRQLGVALR